MAKDASWPLVALDELWDRIQLTPRQADILHRRRAGEKFTDLAEEYGVTPPAIRTEFILAENKEAAIRAWPHHPSFTNAGLVLPTE